MPIVIAVGKRKARIYTADEIEELGGVPGKQGIPGLQGLPGEGVDKAYTHDQQVASMEWTVNHNLLKYPAIQVRDTAGSEIECDIQHTSNQQAILRFNYLVSGYADCN